MESLILFVVFDRMGSDRRSVVQRHLVRSTELDTKLLEQLIVKHNISNLIPEQSQIHGELCVFLSNREDISNQINLINIDIDDVVNTPGVLHIVL